MKLSEIKKALTQLEAISFVLPDGTLVPGHFHVTEIGKITKHFIDCGGVERTEQVANFQLWNANDYDHRLHPEKLQHIIELSEKVLQLQDLEIEVEYQHQITSEENSYNTIGKFGLDFDGKNFLLTTKITDCLAKDSCGIPSEKKKVSLAQLQSTTTNTCAPNSGCC